MKINQFEDVFSYAGQEDIINLCFVWHFSKMVTEQSEESKVISACATPVLWRHMTSDSSVTFPSHQRQCDI